MSINYEEEVALAVRCFNQLALRFGAVVLKQAIDEWVKQTTAGTAATVAEDAVPDLMDLLKKENLN